mgnify:FL=1|jgi:hypothetical protein|tara:strand:- start:353 stop:754 length:402 start_codon:yes stop_codon:yes gene_type:complete
MAFKMKGPSMYPNYRGNKAGTSENGAAYGPGMDLALNKESKKGPDMRATSAPFQMKDDNKKKKDEVKPTVKKVKTKPSQGDFVPAYPGADISAAEYKKMKGLGIKSEAEYAEYKANPKAWAAKNKKNKTTVKK